MKVWNTISIKFKKGNQNDTTKTQVIIREFAKYFEKFETGEHANFIKMLFLGILISLY